MSLLCARHCSRHLVGDSEQDQGPCSCDAYLQAVRQTTVREVREVSGGVKVREGRAGTMVYILELMASIRQQPGLAFCTAGEGSL